MGREAQWGARTSVRRHGGWSAVGRRPGAEGQSVGGLPGAVPPSVVPRAAAGACLTCALGSFLPEITLGSVGGPQAVCWCIDTGYSFILWPLFGPFCCPGRGISLLLMGYVAPQLCPILSTTGGLCSAGTGAWMVSGNTHMEWELVKYAFHFVVSLQVFWNMPASS